MSTSAVESVREAEFQADASLVDRALSITLTGNADLNVKFALDKFLGAAHEKAIVAGAQEVTVDVRRLEFMNSSCLKCFVTWISKIQDTAPDKQYKVAFVSSPSMYWQKRSLHALSCLASDLVTVQTGS